jgi:hypothetical protein
MAARTDNVFWLVPCWISNLHQSNRSGVEPSKAKCSICLGWFYTPMRTHYWPWQPCWISDLHQNNKSGRGPPNEHFCQVWSKSVLWIQRRRLKYEKFTDTDDGRKVMTKFVILVPIAYPRWSPQGNLVYHWTLWEFHWKTFLWETTWQIEHFALDGSTPDL